MNKAIKTGKAIKRMSFSKEELEAEVAKNFYAGSGSAFEEACRMVMEMAKDAFSRHEDREAEILRRVAVELLGRGIEERKKQDQAKAGESV